MTDREKVLAGLRACERENVRIDCRQAGCPFCDEDADSCTSSLARAAVRLLDDTPRVLTLDELLNGSGGGWYEFYTTPDEEDPGGFDLTECGYCRGAFIFEDGSNGMIDPEGYNTMAGCRIWSVRPDDITRTSTPWED